MMFDPGRRHCDTLAHQVTLAVFDRVTLVVPNNFGRPLDVADTCASRNQPVVSGIIDGTGLLRIWRLKLDLNSVLEVEPLVVRFFDDQGSVVAGKAQPAVGGITRLLVPPAHKRMLRQIFAYVGSAA